MSQIGLLRWSRFTTFGSPAASKEACNFAPPPHGGFALLEWHLRKVPPSPQRWREYRGVTPVRSVVGDIVRHNYSLCQGWPRNLHYSLICLIFIGSSVRRRFSVGHDPAVQLGECNGRSKSDVQDGSAGIVRWRKAHFMGKANRRGIVRISSLYFRC